jgi:adenosylmethionine-8-amino-7-oxononanoate aminotransferase
MSTDLVRNDQQAEFIRLFVGSQWAGNASACAIGAGYSKDTAKQKGYQLKRKFADKIKDETVRMIADSATLGLAGVLELAKNATNDSVRLQACKDLLDRAGFNAINQIEISGMDKKSDEELKEELNRLLNANIIDVTPEVSTQVGV